MSSLPPSDPAPFRHLGAGSSRTMRSPLILGLIALLVLVALPLYLMRRPKPVGPVVADAGARAELRDAPTAGDGGALGALPDAGAAKKVVLGEPRSIRCVPKAGGSVMAERCDHLVSLEDAMARAIRENVACAPAAIGPYTVSFVLTVDFERKKLHLWAGRSGTLKKRSAADLIRCVEHALAPPELATVAHQYARYDINVMVSYPGARAPVGGS